MKSGDGMAVTEPQDALSAMPGAMAELAVHYWKLCLAFERELAFVPENRLQSGEAMLRFARRKLETILDRHAMRVVTFDGELWSPALPVSPINPDDVDTDAIVDATIEPTIMGHDAPIIAGKVLLRNA
jgi:hypothetical protein